MASPLINWDDFGNQALLVQELLLCPEETVSCPHTPKIAGSGNSSLNIFGQQEPQGLIILSPDTPLDTVEKTELLSGCSVKKVNITYEEKQKEGELRTPLRDCTNSGQNETKLLSESTVMTPVKSIKCEESSRALCPSSAEFREFLSGIMEVSLAEKDGSFDDFDEEPVKQCQSLVVKDPRDDSHVRKGRTRSGTYILASPTFDLHDPASTTSLDKVESSEKPSFDLLMLDVNTETAIINCMPDETPVFPNNCFPKRNEDITTFSLEDDSVKQKLESENFIVNNCTEILKDSTHVEKESLVVVGEDPQSDALKPSHGQLSKKPSLRKPCLMQKTGGKSLNRGGKQNESSLQIVQPEPIFLEESQDHTSKEEAVVLETELESNKALSHKDNTLVDIIEMDCASENIVKLQETELKEDANVIFNVARPENICTESQETLDIVHKQQAHEPNKFVSAENLTSNVKEEPQHSKMISKSTTYTKLPLMRSKSLLKRPSTGLTNSMYTTTKAVTNVKVKGCDAEVLPTTTVKQQSGTSSLARRESLATSKMSLKPSFRAPSKTTDQSQRAPDTEQAEKLRMKTTNVLEEENGKMVEQKDLSLVNPLKKPFVSKLATKIARKSTTIKGTLNASSVVKDTSMVMKPPPVVDAPGACSKDTRIGLKKPIAPVDGSRTITKKTSPVKALFPVNGSRTVTRDDQPVVPRTITKEAHIAGSRTVTKSEPSLLAPRNQSTPLKSDKVPAPRRLSNIFHTRSSLSHSSKSSVSRNGSFQKPSSEATPLHLRSKTTECEAFKPKLALVQNTPDVKMRRLSMWSPVQKNRIAGTDLAYHCTKKSRETCGSLTRKL